VDVTGSRRCIMAGFGVSCNEPSDPGTIRLGFLFVSY
jgi:hypothetical protein